MDSRMKIGIYIEVLKNRQASGIGKHIAGLIKALCNLDRKNQYYLYYQQPALGKTLKPISIDAQNVKLRPIRFPTKWMDERPTLWWKYIVPLAAKIDRLDVFHGPNHFIPLSGDVAKVVTIHDLAYFYMTVHGEGMDRILKQWTLKSFKHADQIITVSDATTRDCVKEGCPKDVVTTIYQGFESRAHVEVTEQQIQQTKTKFNLPDKYLLSLGTLQPRKNIPYLVEAFAKAASSIPHSLVLSGDKSDSYYEILTLIEKLGIKDRVIFTGYISDEERTVLYNHADVFIYPSKYEGFGLVVLEAMSHNCPVMVTNTSSLPEAVGDAGIIVELNDIQAFAQEIVALTQDEEAKAQLIKKGQAWIEKFTWEQAAKQTLSVYQKAFNKIQ